MAKSEILFALNGQVINVGLHANLSLNDFIRQHTKLKGTKLACGEGGCGACSVLAISYDPLSEKYSSFSLNSCLAPLGSLDGLSIITVEGLGNSKSGFSRIQEAFAEHHASQCGYCTPGFVVACHATAEKAQELSCKAKAEDFMQGMDGNLCRCTGYQPILNACKAMADMEDLGGRFQQPYTPPFPWMPVELHDHISRQLWKSPGSVFCEVKVPSGLWISPKDLQALFSTLEKYEGKDLQLLAGNTAAGVYHEWPSAEIIVSLKGVKELTQIKWTEEGMVFGAAVPFSKIIDELDSKLIEKHGLPIDAADKAIAAHLRRIAGSHVRSAATPGGNLALLVNPDYYLESDFATVLLGARGSVQISSKESSRWLTMSEFLDANIRGPLGRQSLITAVRFPTLRPGYTYWSQKVANRYYNSHALVNLAVSYIKTDSGLDDVSVAVGCPTLFREGPGCEAKVAWQLREAKNVIFRLELGVVDTQTIIDSLHALQKDICPASTTDAPASFYRSAAEGLLFQALAPLLPVDCYPDSLQRLLRAQPLAPPQVPKGRQSYPGVPKKQQPVGLPIEKDRIRLQASGEGKYTSDLSTSDHLFAAVVPTAHALAVIDKIDTTRALKVEGVEAFVGAADIPGENRVPLGGGEGQIFAADRSKYVDQPLGLIVAKTPQAAKAAAKLVDVTYSFPKEDQKPILTLEAGIKAKSFTDIPDGQGGSRHLGDAKKGLKQAQHTIMNAGYTLPSQQHFYMETQTAVAEPQEGGTMLIHSSTQTLDGVQAAVAIGLGIKAHDVTAVCRRVGGGFGGKVARSLPPAAAVAVAAHVVGQPVFYQLDRNEDFRMNGGRSETKIEYDVGFDDDGRISAVAIRGWFLAGGEVDLGWNDLCVLRDGIDQVYGVPNIDIDVVLVKTNLAPRTIMRGPGFLNAAMVMEEVLQRVAHYVDRDPVAVRELNFLSGPAENLAVNGLVATQPVRSSLLQSALSTIREQFAPRCHPKPADSCSSDTQKKTLSRPIRAECWTLPRIWNGLLKNSDFYKRREAVAEFNKSHVWQKRGISINPCRFDSAPQPVTTLVNIYYDSTVLVTHGGLEVGQGLSTKVKQSVVYELSNLLPEHLRPLPLSLVKINDSRTDINPAAGPTWSSTGSEASCAAAMDACRQLFKWLKPAAESVKDAVTPEQFWKAIIANVYDPNSVGFAPATVPLSAQGFFDGKEAGGNEAMQYTSFGAAVSEVEIDVLTGDRRILRSDIHFDCGQSLNPAVDMGQVEGAFVQGLGLMTSEQVIVDETRGQLITDSTWNYKIPSAADIPAEMYIDFLKDSPNPKGVMSSKASGEPSLLLTTSVLYALKQAVQAARTSLKALQTPAAAASNLSAQCDDSAQRDFEGATPSPETQPAVAHPSERGSISARDGYFVFAAPATVARLKQACGDFSVASILQSGLKLGTNSDASVSYDDHSSHSANASDSESSWVHIN